MKIIEYDVTANKILQFDFPNLNKLDQITEDLVSQITYWDVARENHINGFESGWAVFDNKISPFNQEIYEWINQCLSEASKFYFPGRELQFAISDSWMTRSSYLQNASEHNHQNSLLSGILYLTDSSAETIFEGPPREADYEYFRQMVGLTPIDAYRISVKSEKGKLIIFPSRLNHRVSAVKDKTKLRYTYIINAFPTGILSSHHSTFLEYHVHDIRDRYLKHIKK